MKRRLLTALILAALPLSVALAQSWQANTSGPPDGGRLVRQSSGERWWVQSGTKHRLSFDNLPAADLDALPSGPDLDAYLQPLQPTDTPTLAPTETPEPEPSDTPTPEATSTLEPDPTATPTPEPEATATPTPDVPACSEAYLQDAYTWSPVIGLTDDWTIDRRDAASLVNIGEVMGQPVGALRLAPEAGWATYGRQFCTRTAFVVEGIVQGEAQGSVAVLDLPGLLPGPLRLPGPSKWEYHVRSVPLSDGERAQQVEVTVTVDGRLWSRETLQIQDHRFGLRLAAEGDAVTWGPLGFEGVPVE